VSGPTIRYRVRFRGRAESALVAPRAGRTGKAATGAPSPAARVLALAYAVERHVRAGTIKDYREAARRLGISHARMSQVTALLLLAPAIQAEVLGGDAPWSEVRLRMATRDACWQAQRETLRA
jgi:hypothetical protein